MRGKILLIGSHIGTAEILLMNLSLHDFGAVLVAEEKDIPLYIEEEKIDCGITIEIKSLELQPLSEFYFEEERFESRSGWFIPWTIGIPSRGYRYLYKSTIRKQYNKPRFIWRIKKQKKQK